MQTVITVLLTVAAVFVGLFLAIVVGWWWIKRKFKGAMGELAKFGALTNFQLQPRITLRRVEGVRADDDGLNEKAREAIREDAEQLRGLGFDDAGLFEIVEYPDTLMHAFVHPGDGAYAVVTYKSVGPLGSAITWCDVVTGYAGSSAGEPGPMVTHASLEELGSQKSPWTRKAACPGLGAQELVERHLREREKMAREVPGPHALSAMSGAEPLPARTEDFKRFFEDAYAREMDHRLVHGATPEEVRRIAATTGQKPTDEEVNATVAMARVQYDEMLDELVVEEYKRTSGIGAVEWERLESRLFDVRENATPASVVMRLASELDWDEDGPQTRSATEELSKAPIRKAFRDFVKILPRERAFRHLGTVQRPVKADVFEMPADT